MTQIALFVTCIVDQIMPEIGVAATRLLRRAGHTVEFPMAQTCCGQPFFNSGWRNQAMPLARRTIEILEPYDAVVVPGGSCTTMIRVEYPHLLENSPRWYYAARRLANKTYELSEFLARDEDMMWIGSGIKAGGDSDSVTYHDSCHMNRMLGLRDEPRRLLRAAGYSIEEMEQADRCCGFGGVFSVRMPEVSNAMTAEKLRRGRRTAATTIVTADPGCLMQMRGMLQSDDTIQIKHLAVVLDEATNAGS